MRDWSRTFWMPLVGLALLAGVGCQQPKRHHAAFAYYQHRYPTARELVRPFAADRESKDVVLDNLRLGLASLADGGYDEAERALLRAYEYLISGGVNAPDRAIGSTLLYEGVRVWKGEPYEQAMSFYYISTLYMLRGDWENARAAAANALFALRDFGDYGGEPKSMEQIAREAARAERLGDDYFEEGYRLIRSQFALGYLMAATSDVLMGRPEDARRMFEQVRNLNPDLSTLADALEGGQFDTLLLVDMGRGPRKVAYGDNDALVRFVPDGRRIPVPTLSVSADGHQLLHAGRRPVVDLWTLSQYPKWWSLEPMRKAKSAIGEGLLFGGLVTTGIGADADNSDVALAGLGVMAAGLALQASSKADTRHLAMLPRCVYMVPLTLGPGEHDLNLHFEGNADADGTWHDLAAGSPGSPRVYYLRMHDGGGRGMPPWASEQLYSVAAEDYQPGDRPWIMGGSDLTPPTPPLIDVYHSSGVLTDLTLEELIDVYRAEGIVFDPGPRSRTGEKTLDPSLYRHVAEGGRVLFQPRPGTHLYQRITRLEHPPYVPHSEPLRRLIRNDVDDARGPRQDERDD